MNLDVENFTFSETGPGHLKDTAGTPSEVSILVKESLSLVFPDPGIPEIIMTLALSAGPYLSFSIKICV